MKISLALTALALTAAQGLAQRPTSRPTSRPKVSRPDQNGHAVFDRILRASVRDGLVDYLGIRKHHRQALAGYLDAMAKVPVRRLTKSQRLAYYINLYNATMIDVVVGRLAAGYSPAANDYGVFKEQLVRLPGRKVSLNHLENEIIRKVFDEPRIHVALVCGAKSCPPILPRAYRAKDLESVLERNMRAFVSDRARNRIDRGANKLQLSQIFNWYKQDFGGNEAGIRRYVDRYTSVKVGSFRVEFLPYSWELNISKPKGKWASLKQARGGLAKGAYVEIVRASGGQVVVRDAAGKTHTLKKSQLAAF